MHTTQALVTPSHLRTFLVANPEGTAWPPRRLRCGASLAFAVTVLFWLGSAPAPVHAEERGGGTHALLSELDASRRELESVVVDLTPDQATFRPAPGAWSVLECVEHLAHAEAFLLDTITHQVFATAMDRSASTDDEIVNGTVDRSAKVQAPAAIAPSGRWTTLRDALAAFQERRAATRALVRDTRVNLRRVGMGGMDGHQWFLYLSAHTRRHVAQIREVQSHARFLRDARTGLASPPVAPISPDARKGQEPPADAVRVVAAIQRADYEGDRVALQRLHEELIVPNTLPASGAARLRYWRGFALWRRALNGFNQNTPSEELDRDLRRALSEFEQAEKLDDTFVDATLGAISCAQNLLFVHLKDPKATDVLLPPMIRRFALARTRAADNPRFAWILGAHQRFNPPERGGGGPEMALATFERGLTAARAPAPRGTPSPLEPMWGEPELLMSLANAYLHGPPVDLARAERHAREALALVPHWRYVRDNLLPQILKTRQ